MLKKTRNRALKSVTPSIIIAAVFFFTLFGIAYAVSLIDTVSMSDCQKVTNLADNASDYTVASGQDTYLAKQWGIDDTNLDVVWNTFKTELNAPGNDVYVVVMERCIDLQHSELQGKYFNLGYNPIKDENYIGIYMGHDITGQFDEVHKMGASEWKNYQKGAKDAYGEYFHGSHVAGIVGAKHDSNGIAGCNPNVKIIPALVSWPTGEVELFDWICGDLYDAIASTGQTPRIIVQYSVGPQGSGILPYDQLSETFTQKKLAAYKKASDKGILMVFACGNNNIDVGDGTWDKNGDGELFTILPFCGGISADNFVSVAGHDKNRNLGLYTNYSTSGTNAQVHLSAPGNDIVSLGRNGEHWVASGTSMAAPHVSGTASVLWKLFPDATAAEIKTLLLEGAKLSGNMPVNPYQGKSGTKIKDYVKTGFLDAAASVKKSKEVLGASRGLDIEIPVKEMTITPSAYSIIEGNTATVSATTVHPFTADDKDMNFVSSNPAVLWITHTGADYIINTGAVANDTSFSLYADAADGNGAKSNTLSITVTKADIPVTSIAIMNKDKKLTDDEVITIALGESVTLKPVITPIDATITDSDFQWSFDKLVSSISIGRDITVTPTEVGEYTATVTAKTVDVRCKINVTEAVPTDINIVDEHGNPKVPVSIAENGSVDLFAAVTSAGTSYDPSDIKWNIVSGNASLSATTGESVTVTGRSAGEVIVQAKIGTVSTQYNIEVTSSGSTPTPVTPSSSGGGGCNTGSGLALLFMSIVPIFFRRKK